VLRVLYAYLMHCSTMDIPKLKFPRDEIIEVIPAAYQNEAKRIHIPDLDPKYVPGSPEDIRIVRGAGGESPIVGGISALPPIPGLSNSTDPVPPFGAFEFTRRPTEKVVNKSADMVADKLDDED
jgi:6-phosphofructo-2-kinase/fructose-2,6-biphosphatase 4